MNPTTTLAKIRDAHPCSEGWSKLLTGLGYTDGNYDPDRVVSLGDVATTNDAADALWCVRALDWSDVTVRRAVIAGTILLAIQRALKYTTDKQVHECVADIARWCAGDDTVDLKAARQKAQSAAYAYAYAADAAARAYAAGTQDADADAAAAERVRQRQDSINAFALVALVAV